MGFFDLTGRDVAELRRAYDSARPFPHLVIDDLLHLSPDEAATFPLPDWEGWSRYDTTYQPGKAICSDIDRIPAPFDAILRESAEPAFLGFLEQVTGIAQLIPDPYLRGGGLHTSGAGGVLMPHTDFHWHQRLSLFRQINVLLYLNPVWEVADGGCLELFADPKAETSVVTIVPTLGRAVIFRTDDRSVHGFPAPIAPGHRRNSMALYYYTARDSASYAGDTNTYWRRHDEHRGVSRARDLAYRGALQVARAGSRMAHLLNPNRQ